MRGKPNQTKQVRKKWLREHPTMALTGNVKVRKAGSTKTSRIYVLNYHAKKRGKRGKK